MLEEQSMDLKKHRLSEKENNKQYTEKTTWLMRPNCPPPVKTRSDQTENSVIRTERSL